MDGGLEAPFPIVCFRTLGVGNRRESQYSLFSWLGFCSVDEL